MNNQNPQTKSYRNSTSFGKRIEYYIVGLMLKERLDVYLSLVDDHGVDAIIKKSDRTTLIEVQIKACSREAKENGKFSSIKHDKQRDNYWFIFYCEGQDQQEKIFTLSSKEFLDHSKEFTRKSGAKGRHIKFLKRNGEVKEEFTNYEYQKRKFLHLTENSTP